MRFPYVIAVAWLGLQSALAPAHAETRVALVIGNGAYQHLNPLKNPPNDARDLAQALRKLDFDVDLGVDLPLADMQRKVTAFARRAQTADVALAFFAGHGVQAPDQRGSAQVMNYLLPIDADIKDAEDLGFLLTARDILARLQAASSVRILILDACRDNPIPQRLAKGRSMFVPRGLRPEPKTNGTFIAYSTQPDTIADDGADRNSPFVKALLDHIAEPGLDIRLLFADVRRDVVNRTAGAQNPPETSDSLDGRFAFRKAEPVTASLPSSPAAVPPPQAVPEAARVPVVPNTTVLPKTAGQATGGNEWSERLIPIKKGDSLSAILRDLGATPEEAKAIGAVLGVRARDGNLKESQKLRVLLSPLRGTERLQPVRIMLVGDQGIEAIAALSDLGRYVSVDVATAKPPSVAALPTPRPIAPPKPGAALKEDLLAVPRVPLSQPDTPAVAPWPIRDKETGRVQLDMALAYAARPQAGGGVGGTSTVTSEEATRARDLISETIRATTPPESAARLGGSSAPPVHSGWIIQVGAFDAEREARERLNAVQAKLGQKLKHAKPFTEAVVTGDKTFYRARFAGMQEDEAEAICQQLKRDDISCMIVKN